MLNNLRRILGRRRRPDLAPDQQMIDQRARLDEDHKRDLRERLDQADMRLRMLEWEAETRQRRHPSEDGGR